MPPTAARHYALVSACRNEIGYIDGLIDTVARQTLLPSHWVIVDDGSSDDTYARAARRREYLPFLRVVRMPLLRPPGFASQAHAANYGYETLRGCGFDFIGFLDADIRLGPDYYERVVAAFHQSPRLGLAGGAVIDHYPDRTDNVRAGSEKYHVAGGVQLFRRRTFDDIGGYVPIEGGGQDTIADVMAMMHGWEVRTLSQITAIHLRPEGSGRQNVLRRGLLWGHKFYALGYHPIFYFAQCMRRVTRRPWVLGSLSQLIGFGVASYRVRARPVSVEFVDFIRRQQMQRLRVWLGSTSASRHSQHGFVRPTPGNDNLPGRRVAAHGGSPSQRIPATTTIAQPNTAATDDSPAQHSHTAEPLGGCE